MASVASTTADEARVLIDSDFGRADQRLPSDEVRGVLPKGWRDDSSGWADVDVECQPMQENGVRFLRIDVRSIKSGRVQFGYPFGSLNEPGLYRLTMKARVGTPGALTRFGIRHAGKPWQFIWDQRNRFSERWDEESWEFELPASNAELGLWLTSEVPGFLDLAHVRLERLGDRSSLEARIRAEYPDGGPANLMRHSRFPLGLPSGWSLEEEVSLGDDVRITAEAEAPRSGDWPTLGVRSVNPQSSTILRTAPFRPVFAVEDHAARLRVRGNGTWTIKAYTNRTTGFRSRKIAEQAFELTGRWQDLRLEFPTDPIRKTYELELTGTPGASLRIDTFQVGPVSKVEPGYKAPAPFEVALQVPDSDASAGRIQFDDEPATLRFAVTRSNDGQGSAVLKRRVHNVYGEVVDLPDMPLAASDTMPAGVFDFAAFPDRPFGPHRIEVWVERDGQRVSPYDEMVVHRLRRARYWGRDAPHSPFGIHAHGTTQQLLTAKAIGVNWARFHDTSIELVGWHFLEPQPGQWRFRDDDITFYRDHHLHILGMLSSAPSWASYHGDVPNGIRNFWSKYMQPKDFDDYGNYVRTVVDRYRGVIDVWEVWNEPWNAGWWATAYDHNKARAARNPKAGYSVSGDPIEAYTRLMEVAYENAKSANPDALILGFNSTGGNTGLNWSAGVYNNGGLAFSDGVSWHDYSGGNEGYPNDGVEETFNNAVVNSIPAAERRNHKLWMTEGSPVHQQAMGNGMYVHTVPFKNLDANLETSNRIARYLLSLSAQNVDRWFLYTLGRHERFHPAGKFWACMITDDGYLHPSGAAHAHFAYMIEGMVFVERLRLGRNVYAYLFKNKAEEQPAGQARIVAVISSEGQVTRPYEVPVGVSATDLFGNPLAEGAVFDGKVIYLESTGPLHALRAAIKQ